MVADIFRTGFAEFRQFVNPLIAERARLAREPIEFTRVAGGVLHDARGVAYEALHGTQMLGHRNARVAEAMRAFLDGDAPNWFPSRVNPWAGRLARRLCERSGYELRTGQEVGTIASQLNLISVGVGIGFVVTGKSFAYPGGVVVLPLDDVNYPTSFVFAWVKGQKSPALERMIDVIKVSIK